MDDKGREISDRHRGKIGELVVGIVGKPDGGNILVDLDGAEGVLPAHEQVPGELYRIGERIMAYLVAIGETPLGPQPIISRAHKGLLEKLLEMEVPEVHDGAVRIEASVREPGVHSKIAVSARNREVDPVEACVGMNSSRIQAVVRELRGEKIDIVSWDSDPARFVCNAVAPAEVARVLIDAANRTMRLIVAADQLSLAVGMNGQNLRLASQLTEWSLDTHVEGNEGGSAAGGRGGKRWRH
jgi:transcription termination/antitermination protein NusA